MKQMTLNFYNLMQMARSRRRNFYMLDTIINETNEHEAFMTRLMRRNFYMLEWAINEAN